MIELHNLSKYFGTVAAVDNISLQVPQGAFLVLLGPSGCGKTTLLRMLAGLEMPSDGQIVFDGRCVSDGGRQWQALVESRNSGLVFQSYALWPHMSVRGNIEWPLKVMKMEKARREQRVQEVLEMLDIAHLQRRYPNEISGGQQQRVAIARTIAPRPSVLLFDEPLSNLDAKLRVEMRMELMRLHRRIGATAVYVTHDQIEAMTMASHVAVINQGRIEQFGTPQELIERPATTFVAGFVGMPPNNLLPVCRRNERSMVGEGIVVDPPHPQAQWAMYGAEQLSVTEAGNPRALAMDVVESSNIAGRTMLTADNGAVRLTAVIDRAGPLRCGERVHIALPARPACWFGQNGERIGA